MQNQAGNESYSSCSNKVDTIPRLKGIREELLSNRIRKKRTLEREHLEKRNDLD